MRARLMLTKCQPSLYELRLTNFAMQSLAGQTGLEPATSGVTGRRSNQLNYCPNQKWRNYSLISLCQVMINCEHKF